MDDLSKHCLRIHNRSYFYLHWQAFPSQTPDDLSGCVVNISANLKGILINGIWLRSKKSLKKVFRKWFKVVSPIEMTIEKKPFSKAEADFASEVPPLPFSQVKSCLHSNDCRLVNGRKSSIILRKLLPACLWLFRVWPWEVLSTRCVLKIP
jgi:hypothetical protein